MKSIILCEGSTDYVLLQYFMRKGYQYEILLLVVPFEETGAMETFLLDAVSKTDVYFSVRTAAEQFVERQNILKNVDWENYAVLQENLIRLKDL